jgi:hypothetical protein
MLKRSRSSLLGLSPLWAGLLIAILVGMIGMASRPR